jgi:Xaa-Pro aminopeptidase
MSDRAERLSARLSDADVDAILVTDLVNVRYLTGYTGANGVALIGWNLRAFITDFRYVEQAAEEVDAGFDRRQAQQDLLEDVPSVLPEEPLRLAFEEAHVTVRQHKRMRERFPDWVELVGVNGLVEGLRRVKEPEEVRTIQAAAALADRAFVRLIEQGIVGRTERELAHALERLMLEEGATRPSFETIVAAGGQGALPHARPRDVEVNRGELVVIDWGAYLDGYCSDCTRTVATGAPRPGAREVYELVLEAQLAGLDAVRARQSGRAADAVARAVIDDAGRGEHFGHGLGHGVGLDIHEPPRLSQRSEDTLAAGNVVTVEPGVYLPGEFGIRIEDLVVVTEDGCQILTSVDKQLMAVG